MKRSHIIVVGNEKGGSGKSTTVMHVAVSLLRQGRRVACVDLDVRQGSTSRYFDNRKAYGEHHGLDLPCPELVRLRPEDGGGEVTGIEALLADVLDGLSERHDVIILDTPGSYTPLSQAAHGFADTLITPLNDSFVDFDVLARIDPLSHAIIGPSHYAELVWSQKMVRAKRDGGSIDWIVMRNRLGHATAKNRREVERLLDELAKRIGFRQAPGFGERVIFRELFTKGLTLMDIAESAGPGALNMSHVAARQEVRRLIEAMALPSLGSTT